MPKRIPLILGKPASNKSLGSSQMSQKLRFFLAFFYSAQLFGPGTMNFFPTMISVVSHKPLSLNDSPLSTANTLLPCFRAAVSGAALV